MTAGLRITRFIVLVLPLLAGCGDKAQSESGDYSTPEATFATAKAAVDNGDYQAFAACFTPEGQDTMAAAFVMIGGMLQYMLEKEETNPDQARANAASLKQVLANHGISENSRPNIQIDLNATQAEQNKQLRRLAEPVKDKRKFIADFINVMQKVGDKPDARILESNAELSDLKVGEETANGTLAQTRDGKERTSPIVFEKIDGAWKISEIPRLMN